MSQFKTILVVVPPDIRHTAAVRRAVELARLSGGRLHLCCFVYDGLIDAGRASPPISELACRAFVDDYDMRLRGLAAELAHREFDLEYQVLWAPVAHEAIMAEAVRLGADCVVKDVQRESILRRTLFTPLDWKLIRLLPCDLMLVGPHSPPHPGRILAAVDALAESAQLREGLNERILDASRSLAEYAGARLDVVSVAPWFPPNARSVFSRESEYEASLARHLDAFREFAERLQVPPDRRHRLLGAPSEAIAGLAEDLAADVTVVGNAYRSTWDRLLLGSTAETLLQELKTDLLVVKPQDFLAETRKQIDVDAAHRRLAAAQPGPVHREIA